MKSAAPIVVLVLWSFLSFSQDRDELFFSCDTVSADTSMVMLYQKIAMSYRGVDYDSAYYFGWKGLNLAQEVAFEKGIGAMYNVLGTLNFYQSNYDSAINLYTLAYQISLRANDSLRQAALLNNIGTLYSYKAEYDTSLLILFKARELREAINDPQIGSTYNNIGLAYNRMGQLQEALRYYKQGAVQKEAQGATLALSNSYNNIGIILKNLEQYDSAIFYYKKSLQIAEEFGDKNKQAHAHNNLAILYETVDFEIGIAEFHYMRAIDLKIELGDKVGLYGSYNNYATLLNKQKRFLEALRIIEIAEQLEKEVGKNLHSFQGLLTKGEVLKSLGRFAEAFQVQDSAWNMRFHEINSEKNEKIAELEVAYKTAQNEAEIDKLKLESELQKSKLDNSRLQMLFIVVAGMLLAGILVIYFTQRSKKMKLEHEAQTLQIEALQKRLIELNISPTELKLDLEVLNGKLFTELTEREFETLSLSVAGRTNAEIADELFVSISTIKFHLRNTYNKLGVTNRKEALAYVSKKA
jgi:ATP/maltotriose-dependent transcriptional regulator MalT